VHPPGRSPGLWVGKVRCCPSRSVALLVSGRSKPLDGPKPAREQPFADHMQGLDIIGEAYEGGIRHRARWRCPATAHA
jgi:hypothetical protein